MNPQKIVFLDRDGVINAYPGHYKYVTSVEEFRLLPGVQEALRRLTAAGCALFIISNQAGVAKKMYSREALDAITQRMLDELGDGITFSGVYYCTHLSDENCACRKPRTGYVEKAFAALALQGRTPDLQQCYFVGDSLIDVETGKASGMKTILVFSGRERPENKPAWSVIPDFTAEDLSDAADIILHL
ncbi:MAG TPA: HAD family hydrolase [Candidatus Omnitrophota bacterium]|nr:HAD family hydrolase [Candidatus Omnitrophota bacterium]HRZ15184.1 HAD family hydrolase [Candidatus Omnitrophota bacterium]